MQDVHNTAGVAFPATPERALWSIIKRQEFGAITTLQAQNNKNVKVFNVSGWGEEDFTAIKEGNEYYDTFITRTPLMIKDLSVKALVDYVGGTESE